jgi:hypothetical protein
MEAELQTTLEKVKNILGQHQLSTDENLEELLSKTIASRENNIRFTVKDSENKEYIMKYSIVHLSNVAPRTGIRALLNLKNEANFYLHNNSHNTSTEIKIPKLLAASNEDPAWIIIEKLPSDKYYIFSGEIQIDGKGYPEFMAESFVKGLQAFQELPVDKEKFHVMTIDGSIEWLKGLLELFGSIPGTTAEELLQLFENNRDLWNSNTNVYIHADLVPDTSGHNKEDNTLVLLDFEKVQIAHAAHDHVRVVSNAFYTDFRRKYEEKLFAVNPSKEFKVLYYLSRILILISSIEKYKSGRLDHIFIQMFGSKKYEEIKEPSIRDWEEQLSEVLTEIRKLT